MPAVFKLEQYFQEMDKTRNHLDVSSSDVEPLTLREILNMADTECKALWDNLSLAYTEVQGHPLLRKEVAKLYNNVTADDVIILCPQEGICISMLCLAEMLSRKSEPMHAICLYPAYQSLYEVLKSSGCDITYWNISQDPTGYYFDVSQLDSLLRSDTRLLVVNFPHNPTGWTPSKAEWQEIVDWCQRNGIWLFSDQSYEGTERNETCAILGAGYYHTITLGSLSKAYGLPGARIGWLVCTDQAMIVKLNQMKHYTTNCNAATSEILGIIALRNRQQLLDRSHRIFRQNITFCQEFFSRYRDIFELHLPNATSVCLVTVKGWLLSKFAGNIASLCRDLDMAGMMAIPADVFEFEDKAFRLGYGRVDLPQALNRLGQYIDSTLIHEKDFEKAVPHTSRNLLA